MTRREQHEDRAEKMKLMYDLSKHITTLSTGTLLLMTALFEKVFKNPVWTPLVGVSFICFATCVMACVFAMFGFGSYSRSTWNTSNDPVDYGIKAFGVALLLFVVGVWAFSMFALKNL